jgi:FKBP-type peptidyl-prolyl cis-trans isomerase FkpA
VTEDDKTLYALGKLLGRNIGLFALDARELEIVQAGLTESVLKRQPERIDLEVYGPRVDELASARGNQRAVAAKARGAAYRDMAARQAGVELLPSGVITRQERLGDGPAPSPSDRVTVNYQGQLIDGTVFDSSYKRGTPATFPLDEVIQCWTDALGRMRVGGKSRLIYPPESAYGDKGRPPAVPGGATLIFDVELLSTGPPAAKPEPAKPTR